MLILGKPHLSSTIQSFSGRSHIVIQDNAFIDTLSYLDDSNSSSKALSAAVQSNLHVHASDISSLLPLDKQNNDTQNGRDVEKIKVVVYAKHRTGSTFTLDMFARHKDVFSVFEPLNYHYINQVVNLGTKTVRQTLNCKFDGMDKTPRRSRNEWVRTQVFCHSRKENMCRNITMKKVEQVCNNYKHVAVKTIILKHLEELYPVMLQERAKVVHLVRDPRGMVSSKKKVGSLPTNKDQEHKDTTRIYAVAEQYCQNILRDLTFAKRIIENNPYTWKSYYTLVRYEDLARMPRQTIENVYKMTGMKLDSNVKRWIDELSRRNTMNKENKRQPSYSTNRVNPKKTSEGWRRHFGDFEVVNLIQHACGNAMKVLGYLPLSNLEELQGNKSVLSEHFSMENIFEFDK